MEISKNEALDLLRKWQEDGHHLFYLIQGVGDHCLAGGRGKIHALTEVSLRLATDHPADLSQSLFFVDIPLVEGTEYAYHEAGEFMGADNFLETDPSARTLIITVSPMNLRFGLATHSVPR